MAGDQPSMRRSYLSSPDMRATAVGGIRLASLALEASSSQFIGNMSDRRPPLGVMRKRFALAIISPPCFSY